MKADKKTMDFVRRHCVMTRKIKVKNTEDIQKINRIVSQYSYDIWIFGKSGQVDAKSLLGMFLLSLNEPLQLVVEDDVDTTSSKQ